MTGGISKDDLSNIALAAAKEASRQTISETFALLGVNVSNFDDMKKFREDLEFMRSVRSGASKLGARFVLTIVSIVAGAVAIASWEYIKAIAKTSLHLH